MKTFDTLRTGTDAGVRASCARADVRPLGDATWTVLPISRMADVAPLWDGLVRSRPGTPFLQSSFLLPCVEFYADGQERICLLQQEGRLRAAVIVSQRRMGTWQTFQPAQLPLGAAISDGSVDWAVACATLAPKLPGLVLALGLSQLDSRIDTRPGDAPRFRTQDYIRTAWVDVDSDFESYWEARGKNLRQNTRKQRKKLDADGVRLRLDCLTAPQDVADAIVEYGRLESTGWKGKDGTAVQSENVQGRFYRRMLEAFCTLNQGRIYRYVIDDKVVAMDLCVHDDDAIVILKTAYDESCKSISPSTLMRQDEFEHIFQERRFSRIEFYGRIMEWHSRWTDRERELYHATFYRMSWLGRMKARDRRQPAKSDAGSTPEPAANA